MNPELDIDGPSSLGGYLHTALRKQCDNTITSLAYNLVHIVSGEAWSAYLGLAWAGLQEVDDNEGLVRALRKAGEDLDYGDESRNALRCCFRLFKDADFLGMGAWVLKDREAIATGAILRRAPDMAIDDDEDRPV